MNIPAAIGEVVDKITILEIKLDNITDEAQRANILNEYNVLTPLVEKYDLSEDKERLKIVNKTLWEVEDKIRDLERDKRFDEEFISLARQVYITNDLRCNIKREINVKFESDIIEEKSYKPY